MSKRNKIIELMIILAGMFLVNIWVIILNNQASVITSEAGRIGLYTMNQWIIPVIVLVLLKKDGKTPGDIGFSKVKILRQIVIGVILGVLLAVIVYAVPALISGKSMELSQTHFKISGLIYYTFGVAVSEEILFRGYIYQKLLDIRDSNGFAMIVSSVIFGGFHIMGGNVSQMIFAAFFGFVLCFAKYKLQYGTLLSCIFAHGIYGTLGIQVFGAMS